MADLLDMFEEGGKFEGEIKESAKYIRDKSPKDFVVEIKDFVNDVHSNANSPKYKEPYLRLEMEIVDVNDDHCPLMKKIGPKNYQDCVGKPGDSVNLMKELSAAGYSKGRAKAEFRELAELIGCLTETDPEAFLPNGALGTSGLRDLMSNPDNFIGKRMRIVCLEANDKGYYNNRYELVPADEVAPKAKAKAKK